MVTVRPLLSLAAVNTGNSELRSKTKPVFDEIKMDAEAKSYMGEDL